MSRVLGIVLTLLTFLLPVEERAASSRHVIFPDGRVATFQSLPDPMNQALLPIGTPQWSVWINRFATISSHPFSSRQSLTCQLFIVEQTGCTERRDRVSVDNRTPLARRR